MPAKSVATRIEARIHVIRGERVMLDADLAVLYGVETKVVNRAVSRNRGDSLLTSCSGLRCRRATT